MSIQWKDLQVGLAACIVWEDAEGSESWEDIESVHLSKLPLIRTWGEISCISTAFIGISQNIDEANDKVSHIMLIPTGMIRDIFLF
jgi:hypothetical protein